MRNAMRKVERELARKLAPEAVEPPEDLLERLQAEIPDELPALNRRDDGRRDNGQRDGGGRVLRFPAVLGALPGALSGATWLKVAATVVLAVGAGLLALEVQKRTPLPAAQLQEAGRAAQEVAHGTASSERAPNDGTPNELAVREQAARRVTPSEPPAAMADADDQAKNSKFPAEPGYFVETPPSGEQKGQRADKAGKDELESLGYLSGGHDGPAAPRSSSDRAAKPVPAPRPASAPAPPVAEPAPGPAAPKEQNPQAAWVGSSAPITFRGGSPRVEELRERLQKLPRDSENPPEADSAFDDKDLLASPESSSSTKSGTNTYPSRPAVRDLEVEVRSESGEALPGATLELEDSTGRDRTAVATADGRAYFYDVPVGEYKVSARLEGFEAVARRVAAPESDRAETEVEMPLSTLQEEIVVIGEAPETISNSTTAASVVPSGSTTLTVEPGAPAPDAFGKRADRPPVPENPLVDTAYDSLSTFGLDVDSGSYGLLRRHLTEGTWPAPATVRIEELLNAFDYGDPPPTRGDFEVTAQGAPSPFRPGLQLLRLGIKARVVSAESRKPAALTFVIDVSGSMADPGKLELAKQALGLLLDQLEPGDTVALVTYGDHARTVLAPTADKEAARRAIEALHTGGSTNAEAGLRLGYQVARGAFRPGAVNRIVLCSDGVANVGATEPEALLAKVGEEARRGIELTTLGFGMGAYNDRLMEQLADKGDGRYAYLDDLVEAHRVLVEELTGTVQTVARDARVQLELNPDAVKRYRLLGYENRDIEDARFRYDDQDAGEIGSGHAVTVLYELELEPSVPDTASLGILRLRWWSVAEDRFVELSHPVYRRDLLASWDQAGPALRWSALTERFAEILRGQAPAAEMAEVASRLHLQARHLWSADLRRAELADLAQRAEEIRQATLLARRAKEP